YFNDTLVSSLFVSSADGTAMNVTIAAGTPTGAGLVRVFRSPSSQAFGPTFEVIGSAPFIFGFSPHLGGSGQTVDIDVINRDVATGVQFDGVPASAGFGPVENSIRATVPTPARSGLITITS